MRSKAITAFMCLSLALMTGCHATAAVPVPQIVPATLADLSGEIRPTIRSFAGGKVTQLALEPCDGATVTDGTGAQWTLSVDSKPIADRPDAHDYRFTWALAKGTANSVVMAVEFPFSNWSADNFVFVPAAVYDGNRFDIKSMGYPPYWYNKAEWKLDMPTTMTGNNPSLGKGNGPGQIDINTGNASVPLMAFQSPAKKLGWIVLTAQGNQQGNYCFDINENAGRSAAKFSITTAAPANFKAGDSVTIPCRVYAFQAAQRTDLLRRFSEVRKDLNPHVRTEELPFSEAWRLLDNRYQKSLWDERIGMYCLTPPGTGSTWNFIWQLGWCGGGQVTLPLMMQGDDQTRQRALRNLDVIFTKSQTKSGFFNAYGNGEQFASFGFGSAFKYHECLTRSQGDWLYMAQRQFQWIESTGGTVPPHWKSGLQKQADAFVQLWEKRGQFGQFVDVETGDLCIGGSTSGAIAAGGLALASQTYKDPKYLAVAQAVARKYYHDFVQLGYTTGGPGEILSAPDSESAFGLFEAFMALHEVTGSDEWLHDASDLLAICASWTVGYDYRFPPNSAMGRINAHSCGAVWASVANKHGAPGICTWSGDSLLKYYRATGDTRGLELLTDIAHGITQYISREDRKVGNMPPGGLCERVNLSNWEGWDKVGGNIFGSCSWVETAALLTVTQLPGLYVQPDTGTFAAFDNIHVEKLSHAHGVIKLRLTNPTQFPADVKLLVESSHAALQPLSFLTPKGGRAIHLDAGAVSEMQFP
jgi:hypothetical protein